MSVPALLHSQRGCVTTFQARWSAATLISVCMFISCWETTFLKSFCKKLLQTLWPHWSRALPTAVLVQRPVRLGGGHPGLGGQWEPGSREQFPCRECGVQGFCCEKWGRVNHMPIKHTDPPWARHRAPLSILTQEEEQRVTLF